MCQEEIIAVIDINRKEMLFCGKSKDAMEFAESLCRKFPNNSYVLFKTHTTISLKQEIVLGPLEIEKCIKPTKKLPINKKIRTSPKVDIVEID